MLMEVSRLASLGFYRNMQICCYPFSKMPSRFDIPRREPILACGSVRGLWLLPSLRRLSLTIEMSLEFLSYQHNTGPFLQSSRQSAGHLSSQSKIPFPAKK
jgi:hypothetical protein